MAVSVCMYDKLKRIVVIKGLICSSDSQFKM